MSVQIHINGDNAGEAIQELAALAAAFTPKSDEKPQEEKPKRQRPTKTEQPEKKADPVPEEQDEGTEPESSDAEGSDAPIPTDVELRAAAAEVGKKGPEAKQAIKELLGKYGVPNVTAVPDNKRAAFLRDLEALA